ncbi:SpoIVB peptidase [Caldicellulosiruptoraceae bacterium PP1]
MKKLVALFIFYIVCTFYNFIYFNTLPDSITCYKNENFVSINTPFYFNINCNGYYKKKTQIGFLFKKEKIFLISNKNHDIYISLFNIPLKKVEVNFSEKRYLIPMGQVIGIRISTNGILVIGFSDVIDNNNNISHPAKDAGLNIGDKIIKVNGMNVNSCEQLYNIINAFGGQTLSFLILRNNKYININIKPVLTDEREYKIGLWVRSGTSGIGTLTYIDKNNMAFGALGHGISDTDTNILLDISYGEIYNSHIYDIKRSKNGEIGEIIGRIDYDTKIGDIKLNTKIGIYGKIFYKLNQENLIEVGRIQDIHVGPAKILIGVNNVKKLFNIEILKIYPLNINSSKAFIIKIKDPELIKLTGGIVQGMSGSPIIQDNKLIGAVTHVFLNNSSMGYGIFIENMLKISDKIK